LGTFGTGAAVVLVAPSKVRTCYAARLDFSCTNNIAEYEDLLLGLQMLKAMGIRRVILKTDSHVISSHIDKSSKARDPKLEKYLDTVCWGLVLKCYELRTRQHKMLMVKDLHPSKHYLP
jgi:ribonuclease HI